MEPDKLVFLIVAGVIGIAVCIKLWRIILGIVVVGAIAVAFFVMQGKIKLPIPSNGSQEHTSQRTPTGRQQELPPIRRQPPMQKPRKQKPDFVIVGVQQHPGGTVVPKKSQVYYDVRIANQSNTPYDGTILVKGWGGAQRSFQGLRPGESKTIRLPLSLQATGPFQTTIRNIYFHVDPNNAIAEQNEHNNTIGPYSISMH